ncbi:MAG: hypothetical protein ACRD28_01865 [Acidobacteriaceae bacterium]
MAKKLISPKFESEDEEAKWWPKQEDKLADAFEQVAADGTLNRSLRGKQTGAIAPTTIRLNPGDIEQARKQALRKGLKYQTYLKMLIHEALQKETKRAR